MASLRLLVLEYVREYIGRFQGSPSYGEIAAHLGTHRTNVHYAVKSLVKDGMLLRVPGERGLMLPDTRAEALRVLSALGVIVIDGDQIVLSSGKTIPALPMLPVLRYVDRDADDGRGGQGGDTHGGKTTS